MSKVSAEVLDCYVNGKGPGSQVELDEGTATNLEAIGYVRITGKVKAAPKPAEKKEASAAPKKKPAAKAKPKK